MATGDQSDVLIRIKATMPPWFGDSNPILDGILSGIAKGLSFIYALIVYVSLQTRIKTASDGFLDLVAADYFGTSLLRLPGQSDASFRARIIANLLRPRATRNGLDQVLYDLTGRHPLIIEPARFPDVEAYGHFYYGQAAYGNLHLPYQAFVTAYRPKIAGVGYLLGYNTAGWGYGTATASAYVDSGSALESVSDADLQAAVNSVKPVGSTIWMNVAA